jgi:hypothetical protein
LLKLLEHSVGRLIDQRRRPVRILRPRIIEWLKTALSRQLAWNALRNHAGGRVDDLTGLSCAGLYSRLDAELRRDLLLAEWLLLLAEWLLLLSEGLLLLYEGLLLLPEGLLLLPERLLLP